MVATGLEFIGDAGLAIKWGVRVCAGMAARHKAQLSCLWGAAGSLPPGRCRVEAGPTDDERRARWQQAARAGRRGTATSRRRGSSCSRGLPLFRFRREHFLESLVGPLGVGGGLVEVGAADGVASAAAL